jgi:hypothetical protein
MFRPSPVKPDDFRDHGAVADYNRQAQTNRIPEMGAYMKG